MTGTGSCTTTMLRERRSADREEAERDNNCTRTHGAVKALLPRGARQGRTALCRVVVRRDVTPQGSHSCSWCPYGTCVRGAGDAWPGTVDAAQSAGRADTMRRFVLEMTACAALASSLAFAQTARVAHPRPATVESVTSASLLTHWLVNPAGLVDGVLLEDGRAFYFDPSIGRTLVLSIRLSDPMRVDARDGARHLIDERDGSSVVLTSFPRGGGPGAQPALERMVARGNIAAFLRLPEGAISGFILDTGEQVRIAPTLGVRLGGLPRGAMVVVEGFGRQGTYGVGIRATHVIDGQGRVWL
jgi:hypothetical protein